MTAIGVFYLTLLLNVFVKMQLFVMLFSK